MNFSLKVQTENIRYGHDNIDHPLYGVLILRDYLDLMEAVLENGSRRENRTGIDTIALTGQMLRFDLKEGFPAMTTKRLAWKPVVSELLWFLEGSSDERRLAEILYEKPRQELKDKTTIWTANFEAQGRALGYEDGELGPVYGCQWRNFNGQGIDQIQTIINNIKENPESRRHVLTAWNPAQIGQMALPPCHLMAIFTVDNGELSCMFVMRSTDVFLGLPFNIASYALLTHMIAKVTGLRVRELVYVGNDVHIYSNHMEAVKEQISRIPGELPILEMPEFTDLSVKTIKKMKVSDFKLIGYEPQPTIKAEMAV